MKLAYKDEQDMVDLASRIDNADVCFYPAESDVASRFLESLRRGDLSQRERPDFEDPAASLLLEAMVVDDHPRPGKKDKTRTREGVVLRELKEAGLDVCPDVNVLALVSSGLPTEQDHNYGAYVDHFTRTVLNHANKGRLTGPNGRGTISGSSSSMIPRPTSRAWEHLGLPVWADLIGGSPIRPSWMR